MGRMTRWVTMAAMVLAFSGIDVTSAEAARWSWGSRSSITLHGPYAPRQLSPRRSPSVLTFTHQTPWTRPARRDLRSYRPRRFARLPIIQSPRPVAGIPEPNAALLFAVGFGAVALGRRSG